MILLREESGPNHQLRLFRDKDALKKFFGVSEFPNYKTPAKGWRLLETGVFTARRHYICQVSDSIIPDETGIGDAFGKRQEFVPEEHHVEISGVQL